MKPTATALLLLLAVGYAQAGSIPISSVDVEPTNLSEVNCSSTERFTCEETPWVYCIDAQCDAPDPKTGVSSCYCWIQAPGKSQAPPAQGAGAQCAITARNGTAPPIVGGSAMCDSMMAGDLWSTFGYLSINTSYLSPFALNECKKDTPFTYCWGAKCVADPNPGRPNGAICQCPWVTANNPVNIQIDVTQCAAEMGKTCDFVHNGNPSGFVPETFFIELYENITGKPAPGVPTCENRPSTEPTDLADIGCDDHTTGTCNATWVYCIDAICEEPINGVSICYCWIQAAAESILPATASSGAPCYQNTVNNKTEPYGDAMCDSMKEGKLWSTFGGYGKTEGPSGPTFGPKNTSFLPPFALNICPPNSGFVYCWGAACKPDPLDPENRAICECPFVSSPKGASIAIWDGQCEEQKYHTCDFTHNGGPRGSPVEQMILDSYEYGACDAATANLPTCEVKTEPSGFTALGPYDARGSKYSTAADSKTCGVTLDECAQICDDIGENKCHGFVYVEGYKSGYNCCLPKKQISYPLPPFKNGDFGATYVRYAGLGADADATAAA